jgi:hypothetical protein
MEADPDTSQVAEVCLPFLRNAQNVDGGWGFHPGSESRVEPTCWALQALGGSPSRETHNASLARGFEYLRKAQLPDGSWPATPEDDRGCWVTSLCTWTLAVASGIEPHVTMGFRWICQDWPADSTAWRRFVARFSARSDVAPIHTAYRGWAWTQGTSSWVEPTSFALIALEHAMPDSLPSESGRRRELAEALLYDRMCPGGGWNCGNPLVYGVPGEPLVVPTVWALIALRRHPMRSENAMSLDWLEGAVAGVNSAGSLALAKICLETHGRSWTRSAPCFAALYEKNGFLESVQVAAWVCLALGERTGWLNPVRGKTA